MRDLDINKAKASMIPRIRARAERQPEELTFKEVVMDAQEVCSTGDCEECQLGRFNLCMLPAVAWNIEGVEAFFRERLGK